MTYRLLVTAEAQRQSAKLPPKVINAILAFMTGPLLDNPKRLGKPLAGELTGFWSAPRGDYRVVYEINEEVVMVTIVRVGPRRNVYQ